MILPAKHLDADQALITVAAELLSLLAKPQTVSALWTDLHRSRESGPVGGQPRPITFDWFVLALDVIFALGAVELTDGRLVRHEVRS